MIKIYKLIDNTNGNIYIGSTIQKYLSNRLSSHLWDCKTKNKHGCVSREIIKNGDYKIELIEETDDKSRERYWIENTDCINKNIPGRTIKEWKENNKESIKVKQSKKHQKNRDKNLKRMKEYNEYRYSWGGDLRNDNCNLLKIDPDLFIS